MYGHSEAVCLQTAACMGLLFIRMSIWSTKPKVSMRAIMTVLVTTRTYLSSA